jgi:hypothetical protein
LVRSISRISSATLPAPSAARRPAGRSGWTPRRSDKRHGRGLRRGPAQTGPRLFGGQFSRFSHSPPQEDGCWLGIRISDFFRHLTFGIRHSTFWGSIFAFFTFAPPCLRLAAFPTASARSLTTSNQQLTTKTYTPVHISKPTKSDAGLQGQESGQRMVAGCRASPNRGSPNRQSLSSDQAYSSEPYSAF